MAVLFATIIIIVSIITLIWTIKTYNHLVNFRNAVRNAWSQVEVQLTRRHDLVLNLVEIVRGYAKHEKETLTSVIEARSKAIASNTPEGKLEAEGFLSQALGRLLVVVESYPSLKANTNFQDLQTRLSEVELEISISRNFYNDSVRIYQNIIEGFPTILIASILGFRSFQFFSADETIKKMPQIRF